MKKIQILATLLFLFIIPAIAQKADSNKLIISDLGDRIQLSTGDTVMDFSYEYFGEYYLNKAINRAGEGDFEGAISELNAALLYVVDDPNIYFNRGLAKYYLEDYTSSIEDLSIAIELNSSHEDALNQRGIIYSKNNEYSLAEADFDHAIKFYPDNSKAYYNKGINYLLKGNSVEACRLLEIAKDKGDEKAAGVIEQYCY